MKHHVISENGAESSASSTVVVVDDNGLQFATISGSMSMTLAGLLIDALENPEKRSEINKYMQLANSRWMK
mgnify:CR=1 FL=1